MAKVNIKQNYDTRDICSGDRGRSLGRILPTVNSDFSTCGDAMKVEVLPNDNEKEREDRHGRVRVSRRRTWVLVVDGEVHGEYRTKTLAKEAGVRLSETAEGGK